MVSLGRRLIYASVAAVAVVCADRPVHAGTASSLLAACRPDTPHFSQTAVVRPITAQMRRVEPADLTFQATTTVDGGIQVEARGGDLVFRKKVLPDGSFVLELNGRGDNVLVAFNQDTITVGRNRRQVTVAVGSMLDDGLSSAQRLLAGSKAVSLLRLAAAAVQDADDDSAASASLLVGDAVIGMLTGDTGAPARVARHLARHARAGVRRAAMQTDCYYSWEGSVLRASYEWEDCARAFSVWNPTRHLCALRWTIQVESYWFTFLSCTGFSAF